MTKFGANLKYFSLFFIIENRKIESNSKNFPLFRLDSSLAK